MEDGADDSRLRVHRACVLPEFKASSFASCLYNTTFWFLGDSNARAVMETITNNILKGEFEFHGRF